MKRYKIISFLLFIIIFSCCNVYGINAPTIYSKYAVAIEEGSLNTIYEKNAHLKVYPASITKIMTAILTLENISLDKTVVVSKTALNIPWDSSTIYLKEGEILSIKDLLYGLLLNSGNDAANVLAEAVSGSIQDFVVLMNNKAREIGCTGTNFVNAHGYSDDNHYSTAMDIAKIFNYCVQNETFLEIISTKKYIINETNKTNWKRNLANTNRLILTKSESIHARYYEYAIGGKTGYTDEAGRTLVTIGKKDGKTIIIAVFKAGQVNGQDARYTDAINLFEHAFNNYKKIEFANTSNFNFIYTNYDNKTKYNLEMRDKLELLIENTDEISDISYSIDLNEQILNSIQDSSSNNQSVGTISFIVNTNTNSYNLDYSLFLKDTQSFSIINSSNYFIWILIVIVAILFIVFICIITYLIMHKNHKKQKRNSHRQINFKE